MLSELTFEEDASVRKLLKEKLGALGQMNDPTVGGILDFTFESGVLLELFQIILKPYAPTILHRAWNAACIKLHRIDRNEIIKQMTNSEIARATVDFFHVNAKWMSAYLYFADSSILNMPEIPILKGLISLKNPLYSSRMGTRN